MSKGEQQKRKIFKAFLGGFFQFTATKFYSEHLTELQPWIRNWNKSGKVYHKMNTDSGAIWKFSSHVDLLTRLKKINSSISCDMELKHTETFSALYVIPKSTE